MPLPRAGPSIDLFPRGGGRSEPAWGLLGGSSISYANLSPGEKIAPEERMRFGIKSRRQLHCQKHVREGASLLKFC